MTMDATELTWADQIDRRTTLRTRREAIRELVQVRFGGVSPRLDMLIDGMGSEEDLKTLFRRAIAAQTEDELV